MAGGQRNKNGNRPENVQSCLPEPLSTIVLDCWGGFPSQKLVSRTKYFTFAIFPCLIVFAVYFRSRQISTGRFFFHYAVKPTTHPPQIKHMGQLWKVMERLTDSLMKGIEPTARGVASCFTVACGFQQQGRKNSFITQLYAFVRFFLSASEFQ